MKGLPALIPASVAERLRAILFRDRAVAYLHVDPRLNLVEAGGKLEDYGLAGLRPGEPVLAQAFFLEGLLPPPESPYVMPSIELPGGRATDLCLEAEGESLWIILLEVTAERDAARRLQQKAYDMTLAREREARLNRELAAANAALLTAQRELEASRDRVRAQAAELAEWNRTLEDRVATQLAELERLARLKRFLAPSLAELIVSTGNERMLESHRRDIAALFCDLRGFTAFAESAEPEEVMALLHDYHRALIPLIEAYEGTLDRFVGDGLVVFFNDPLPCPDPAARAVRLAVAMRDAVAAIAEAWRQRDHHIGFGIGVAQGFATLGKIGFEGRFDYSAIGTVINTAARLCDAAKDGQILVTSRIAAAVAGTAELGAIGTLAVKGLRRPLSVSNVERLKVPGDGAAAAVG